MGSRTRSCAMLRFPRIAMAGSVSLRPLRRRAHPLGDSGAHLTGLVVGGHRCTGRNVSRAKRVVHYLPASAASDPGCDVGEAEADAVIGGD